MATVTEERDSIEFDVVIVGAGPSGLSAAIRLKQLCIEAKLDLSICLLEKGAEVGSHILSGAILEPRALHELVPDWKERQAPLNTRVLDEKFMLLTRQNSFRLPTWFLPSELHNQGNYVVSLGNFCRWLAAQAEELGVEIFPGFAASEVVYHEDGSVKGVATGDMGIGRDGSHKPEYQPGMEIHAKYTLFAEGCRGSLTKTLFQRFGLREGVAPQTYGIGIKELWEVDDKNHKQGLVMHTAGWPMDRKTYGGSFLYHLEDNMVSVGLVVGLDYENPYLSPFEEFQRFKTHPAIRPVFDNARRISYGARAINEGGLQSVPKLVFPGGILMGCAAGFVNVPKIKGSHTAMKTGMMAAEAVFQAIQDGRANDTVNGYTELFRESWVYRELYKARNFRPAFRHGLFWGIAHGALDLMLFRGKAPWTFGHHADHLSLKKAVDCRKINYPKPDGKVSFDRLSSVFLSNTNHEEDQPVHLVLKDGDVPIEVNLSEYDSPEQRYCPAGVYEIVGGEAGEPRLQINAQNCVHCKSCDIKDPKQNITWMVPEGGGGPNYPNM